MPDDSAPGISVIEQMAASYHEHTKPPIRWHQLSGSDRMRLMDRMEAAMKAVPDTLTLKVQMGTATIGTGLFRDTLLSDHRHAKTSAVYGR